MKSNTSFDFDLQDFESQVLSSIKVLKTDDDINDKINLLIFGEEKEKTGFFETTLTALALDLGIEEAMIAGAFVGSLWNWKSWKRLFKTIETGEKTEKIINLKAAYEFLMQKDISPYICPALKSITNDAYDIGKTLVPVLVPLALVGTITIPLNSVFFGMLALIIAKSGISTICPDEDIERKQK
jgi:hypothetical protein